MKLIIVDDHQEFRSSLCFFITSVLGHEIIAEASSGEQFLSINFIDEADIILMDLRMKNIDGFETSFKTLERFASSKIICVSCETERAKLETLIEAGFKGFIKKTDVFQHLKTALQTVLSGQYYYPDFKKIEIIKKLEVAQKAYKFNKGFLAKMSHEIRTPLTGVLGMVELLEQTELNEKQIDIVKDLKSSGEHLKEIINMVLDYSKLEAGGITLKPIVFQLIPLFEQTKLIYRNNLNTGVDFFLDVDSRIPNKIIADKLRVSQLINNLVSNAIKFTKKGSITLSAQMEKYWFEKNQVKIKVEVRDTGIGISKKLKQKLFKPFVQGAAGELYGSDGTGLGLSICQELADILGGEIGVESKVGVGSTFWFSFLAKPAEEITPPRLSNFSDNKTKKLRILLVEDALLLQKYTKLILNSMGHDVHVASNGQQALDIFETEQFDLILMDVNMPVMDGITATNKLKEKYFKLPPIVGLSANASEGDRQKYLRLGMDEYIVKPFTKNDLEMLVLKICENR